MTMCNFADDKIRDILTAEFPELIFEVFSENGQINQNFTIYTIFADGEIEDNAEAVIEFAKTVFDEVFVKKDDLGPLEMVFNGLITVVE